MNVINKQFLRWYCIATLTGCLVACSSDPNADLEEYVAKVKSQQTSRIDPLPEFKPYESFAYQAADLRDPFTEPTYSPNRLRSSPSIACAWLEPWNRMTRTGRLSMTPTAPFIAFSPATMRDRITEKSRA